MYEKQKRRSSRGRQLFKREASQTLAEEREGKKTLGQKKALLTPMTLEKELGQVKVKRKEEEVQTFSFV